MTGFSCVPSGFKSTVFALFSLLSILSVPSFAQQGQEGSVFNVFLNGKIQIGAGNNSIERCQPLFYFTPQQNAPFPNFASQGLCTNLTNQISSVVKATGNHSSRQILPPFLGTSSLLDVNFATLQQVWIKDGTGTPNIFATNGQATVSAGTIIKQGTMLVLPGGEFARVQVQNGGLLHFQSAPQGVRIKELNVYGCNNGSIEVEPGDYYIDKLTWYGNCNLKVTGLSGVARLFVKNGFVINQPACWNMAEGTCLAPLSLSSIQNQSPDRLSIRVYQGDVSVQGGAQVSAGLYVDKGNITFNNGSYSSFVGESFAQNISTQNNPGTYYGYKPTELTQSISPTITLLSPSRDALTNNSAPTISYQLGALCGVQACEYPNTYFSEYRAYVTLDGKPVAPFAFDASTARVSFSVSSPLSEGLHKLVSYVVDANGRKSVVGNDQFTVDTVAPKFLSVLPNDGTQLSTSLITLSGNVDDRDASVVLVDSEKWNSLGNNPAGSNFSWQVNLKSGANLIKLSAIDKAGNRTDFQLNLTYLSPPPSSPILDKIVVGKLNNGIVTLTGSAGAITPGLSLLVTNVNSGKSFSRMSDASGSFQLDVSASAGDILSLQALSTSGTLSSVVQIKIPSDVTPPLPLPPDPVTIAPPLATNVPTLLSTSTEFLYSGSNPIQTGVLPGTIQASTAGLLRGKILNKDNQALSGVVVSILNHPEFGQTISRADGMFDMVINAGGKYTLNYSRAGFLSVQRTKSVSWGEYAIADDIVMIPLDSASSTIDLSSKNGIQIARASIVSDKDGSRQATILIPPGTTANVVMPNGELRPLSTATIRTTEYTVGNSGPKAMPGSLPTASAYTYAAEVSVDEAIAVGSDHVQFNQPVYYYVENFLKFPVGAVVPSGYYDRLKAGWIPSVNGVVVKILGIHNGIAQIDSIGAGNPDDPSRLQEINITDEERIQLAKLYAIGTTLWRTPLTHFTPWDFNWPWGPPKDSGPPSSPGPSNAPPPVDNPDIECGSIIDCQNRILGESIPIVGTPYTINYKSSRMQGAYIGTVNIPLSGDFLPPNVKRIVLDVTIAGQALHKEFDPILNQNYVFNWDGLDAYGRQVVGLQTAVISVGYVYPMQYFTAYKDFQQSFGTWGDRDGPSFDRKDLEVVYNRISSVKMGTAAIDKMNLGGWTIDVHHTYNQNTNVLELGDGSSFNPSVLDRGLKTVAGVKRKGNGEEVSSGDGGLATEAVIPGAANIAMDSAGNVYISEASPGGYGGNLRKVNPQGIISTVTGILNPNENWATGQIALGDGAVVTDTAGNIYTTLLGRVIKRNAKGEVSTVAGNGSFDTRFIGKGFTSPLNPILAFPSALAFDKQNALYIIDRSSGALIRVSPDGQSFSLLVGGDIRSSCRTLGDGGIATNASLCKPSGIAIDDQGNIYIADTGNNRIRKIGLDGTINTIAGNGRPGDSGMFGIAKEMSLNAPRSVSVDKLGNVYFTDSQNNAIRMVSVDGKMRTIAGLGDSDKDAYALQTQLVFPDSLIWHDQGLLFSDSTNRVRKLEGTNFESAFFTSALISSRDATQLFTIDGKGLHSRTQSSFNGAEIYRFNYDDKGYLTQIIDSNGLITKIERDPQENVSAIVAPKGQRTTFMLDGNGYLAIVTNPASETFKMQYDNKGLLTSFVKPNGVTSFISYDATGNLVDDKIAGVGWSFSRVNLDSNSYYVTKSSGMGRTTRYQVENLPNGDILRTNIFADGTKNTELRKANGQTLETDVDGTVAAGIYASDPRFGIQSDYLAAKTIRTPGGLQYQFSQTRQINLKNPKDVLSVVSQVQTTTTNGKTSTASFTSAENRWSFTSAAGRSQDVYLDAVGKPLKVQQAGVESVNYSYDAEGRVVKITQGARNTDYTYDGQGNVATETNSAGKTTAYEYDLAGRVVKQTYQNGQSVSFTYDASGNLTGITPPSRPTHLFQYNGIDDLQNYNPPAIASGGETQYQYNLDRQITQIQRPDGSIISFNYNSSGKLERLVKPDGNTAFEYSSAGQLTQLIKSDGSKIIYAYDGFLPISQTWVNNSTNPVRGEVMYSYNSDFLVKEIKVHGVAKSYAYDNDGLLTQAGDITYRRDSSTGFVSGTQIGNISTSSSYNSFGELNQEQTSGLAGNIYNVTYQSDNHGRIIASTEVINDIEDTYTYAYSDLDQLTKVSKNGALLRTYNYDANGNRLSITAADGKVILASYDNQDRLLKFGSNTYDYGRNGETKRKSVGLATTQYVYDVIGNLTQVLLPDGTKLDYLIDASNRRVGKMVNGLLVQSFLYENQLRPVAELDNNGNVKSRFIYGTSSNVPDYMEQNGKRYRFIKNHLGSPRLIIDVDSGSVMQRMDYDEWGNVISDTNPGFQPFGFAGGLYDRDTKLVRFGARDYDSETGRWTAKDPIGFAGGDSSLYGYVGQNPISWVDPLGLARFGKRALKGMPFMENGLVKNYLNIEVSHEQIFFSDGKTPSNLGYFSDGKVKNDPDADESKYIMFGPEYDDATMRKAVANAEKLVKPYCIIGSNCQDFADLVRNEYNRIKRKKDRCGTRRVGKRDVSII